MVLTRLILNLNNANARRDFSNRYQLHATIKRIFEDADQKPLWRLEETTGIQPPVLLVQTKSAPSLRALEAYDDSYALTVETKTNELLNNLQAGEKYYFRVHANPTVTREGKRHGLVKEEDQLTWLERQISRSGNDVMHAVVSQSRRERFRKRAAGHVITLQGVLFDGIICANSPAQLRQLVQAGIGHARGFGYGLITLMRC